MITIRPSGERGHFDHGWLNTYHTFSFDRYYNPKHMGFRDLRVINEDRVAPGQGFGTHPHRDMEIITYIVSGALEHRDSMGNGSVIRAGQVQRMTAGTGVTHSEFNASKSEDVHLLQIWILPQWQGLTPGYEETTIGRDQKHGILRLIAGPGASNGVMQIHQDVLLYASVLNAGDSVAHTLAATRHAWVQLVSGEIRLNDQVLHAGDGAAVSDEPQLRIDAKSAAELLLFDLN